MTRRNPCISKTVLRRRIFNILEDQNKCSQIEGGWSPFWESHKGSSKIPLNPLSSI